MKISVIYIRSIDDGRSRWQKPRRKNQKEPSSPIKDEFLIMKEKSTRKLVSSSADWKLNELNKENGQKRQKLADRELRSQLFPNGSPCSTCSPGQRPERVRESRWTSGPWKEELNCEGSERHLQTWFRFVAGDYQMPTTTAGHLTVFSLWEEQFWFTFLV